MDRFSNWLMYNDYTACGEVFDVGNATSRAIMNYGRGIDPLECGGISEFEFYDTEMPDEADNYNRLRNLSSFSNLAEEEIKSSGYVIDTLEASIWCLLNTNSYKECVLKAVNLGNDTDTVGSVVGGLAGIYYGSDDIPEEWLDVLVRRQYIEELCEKLQKIG